MYKRNGIFTEGDVAYYCQDEAEYAALRQAVRISGIPEAVMAFDISERQSSVGTYSISSGHGKERVTFEVSPMAEGIVRFAIVGQDDAGKKLQGLLARTIEQRVGSVTQVH